MSSDLPRCTDVLRRMYINTAFYTVMVLISAGKRRGHL